jgi:nucleoside-diphosphate-sugar epimerase
MRVCVTGSRGRVGRATVADLRAHGHEVVPVDLEPVVAFAIESEVGADLRDAGQALEVLQGCDAVVHLANIPAPGIRTPAVTFNDNMAMNFNVFHAAATLGLQRVVWASSETTLGLPFDVPPRYAPVDEDHYPHPTTTYALSKVASETVAAQIAGNSRIPCVALRFSNVFLPEDYALVPGYWEDPRLRSWNLWGYIDARDAAQACRLALEVDVSRAQPFIIAAADTVMVQPSRELMAEVFPDVPLRRELGEHETLLAIDRARALLGFEPAHSWRDHVQVPGA